MTQPHPADIGSIDSKVIATSQPTMTVIPIVTVPVQQEDKLTRLVNYFRKIPCAGIIMALFSGLFFATAGFIVKLVPNVNPIQIVVSRSVKLIYFVT